MTFLATFTTCYSLYSLIFAASVTALVVASSLWRSRHNVRWLDGVPIVKGIPFLGCLDFFTNRDAFVLHGVQSGAGAFQFNIGKLRVFALSGAQGRKAFFTTPHLNFTHGYRLLFGAAPQLRSINQQGDLVGTGALGWYSKNVIAMVRRDRVEKLLPLIIKDSQNVLNAWEDETVMNPFDTINKLTMTVSLRVLAAHEFTQMPDAADKVIKNLRTLSEHEDVVGTIFPKFLTWQKVLRLKAVASLWFLFKGIVEKRIKEREAAAEASANQSTFVRASTPTFDQLEKGKDAASNPESPAQAIPEEELEVDALTHLLNDGAGIKDCIGFMLFSIFAGSVNTVNGISWLLIHLAHSRFTDPQLVPTLQQEIDEFVGRYTSSSMQESGQGRRRLSLSDLQSIPLSIWEAPGSLPLLDRCIKEVLRIYLSGVMMRRNLTEDMEIPRDAKRGGLWPGVQPSAEEEDACREMDEKSSSSVKNGSPPGPVRVPVGSFLGYPLADVHHNPAIYRDPLKFDPSRFEPGRNEDRNAYLGLLIWGAGRYACPGSRFAKLEMQIMMVLIMFNFHCPELVTDETGKHTRNTLPTREWGKMHVSAAHPSESPWIKLTRRK